MTAAVEVHELSKRFRLFHERNQSIKATILRRRRASFEEFWALRDVSFAVDTGVTFGIIGENGSGKSTLLKCLARILRPDAGSVAVNGSVSALLELGAGFHPELSGRENVFLNAAILGLGRSEVRRRFDDIVEFAGLERFIDTPVKNYSSGMYVRLGFSVAINVDPDVLLVDEVLAVGDESFQRRCGEKFAELRASGRTIVLVSHALETVSNLCDQAAWLEQGQLKQLGPASAVVDEYLGGVHTDRQTDEEGSTRWGSGEGTIDRVELLDADGRPTRTVRTGDAVLIRFHVSTRERIARPVFGLAVHSLQGIHITGPNTRLSNDEVDEIDGSAHVDFVVDRLLLLPGTYDVSAALYDYSCLHPYDHRHRSLRFDVEPGEPEEHYGFVSLGGRWDVSDVGTAAETREIN